MGGCQWLHSGGEATCYGKRGRMTLWVEGPGNEGQCAPNRRDMARGGHWVSGRRETKTLSSRGWYGGCHLRQGQCPYLTPHQSQML